MLTPAQNYVSAIKAYSDVASGKPLGGQKAQDAANGGEFAELVQSALKEAVKIGERSENLTISGINDRADISKVVSAVAEAELTLQTVVTVRDKVLEAYREIIRMPM